MANKRSFKDFDPSALLVLVVLIGSTILAQTVWGDPLVWPLLIVVSLSVFALVFISTRRFFNSKGGNVELKVGLSVSGIGAIGVCSILFLNALFGIAGSDSNAINQLTGLVFLASLVLVGGGGLIAGWALLRNTQSVKALGGLGSSDAQGGVATGWRGLVASLESEAKDFFEKDKGWKVLALSLVGALAIVVVIQQGVFSSPWQAECEDNWGSYFEERFYSENEINRLVEVCVKIAQDWEDSGVAEETIWNSLIYAP